MSYRRGWCSVRTGAWCVVVVLAGGGCFTAAGLEAGAASVVITPPIGTPLNGYGDRMGRGSIGVHDPITVRCLYLNDGQTALMLLTSDLCVINRELRARVLELAPRDIRPEHIILTATHTHSGPGGMLKPLVFRAVSGRFCPEVLEQTAQGFSNAMRLAYENRKQAAIGYGTFEQNDLTTNRRYDNGPVDHQVGVIRVDDRDGTPIAIAANMAAHPTTVSDDDLYIVSADYPGFFYSKLEELSGSGCVAMFMNGAEGNQRPTNPENREKWERTASLGRLLAERVKAASDKITCVDAKLRVGYAMPDLPMTNAPTLAFPSTVLQTVEINDLLLTFVPGEACVEIGLELRKRALARGYVAQFTVDLSNDFVGYFVPPEYYSKLHYEAAMNFYGPGMLEWYCREFSKLMSRGEAEKVPAIPESVAPVSEGGGLRLSVTGTPYAMGYQRGAAFRDVLRAKHESTIVEPMKRGELLPDNAWLKMAAPYLDATPVMGFALGVGIRPLLQGLSGDAFAEVRGMADGAGMAFDAVWLVQAATVMGAQRSAGPLYRAPFCTMFASVGERGGDVVVGRNLDWSGDDASVVVESVPEQGHAFTQVGFGWNLGVFTGMNDAGLVLCAERMESLGIPPIDGAPVEFILRDLLQSCDRLDAAVKRLQSCSSLRGYLVLIAGGVEMGASVVELGDPCRVRTPVKGVVLAGEPGLTNLDAASKVRYGRLAGLLEKDRAVTVSKAKSLLGDREGAGDERILNERTRHSVVFEPKARKMWVAFANGSGTLSDYTAVSVKGSGK